MRGIWMVVNHKAIMLKDTYLGFNSPQLALKCAKDLGWKEEVFGAFDESPRAPITYMDKGVHVSILFVPVVGE